MSDKIDFATRRVNFRSMSMFDSVRKLTIFHCIIVLVLYVSEHVLADNFLTKVDLQEKSFISNVKLFSDSLNDANFENYAAFLLQNLKPTHRGYEHLSRLQKMINNTNRIIFEVDPSPSFDPHGKYTPLSADGAPEGSPRWLHLSFEAPSTDTPPKYIVVTSANHYHSFSYSMIDALQETSDVAGLSFILVATSRPRYSDMFNPSDKTEVGKSVT